MTKKKVVFAITPNPALDLSGVVDNLTPNEKSYVYGEERAPGGNAINSARILRRLEIPVVVSGFLGGSTGNEIKSLLQKEKIKNNFIEIAASSRINITIANASDHQQTRLSFPGPNIKRNEKKRIFELLVRQKDISMLVIGGSLPPGFTPQDVTLLMKLAQKRGAESVVDFPGAILSQVLDARPMLIKPNLEEFQALTKSRAKTIGSVVKKARELMDRVQIICVSSVEGGAVLVSKQGFFFGRCPKVRVRSSVGAGDSMVGAMVAQLYKGNRSMDEVLRWGLAAAAATLEESGTRLARASEINHYYEQAKVQKLTKL